MKNKQRIEHDRKFPKSIRLLKQGDFDRVHQANWFAADDVLVIKAVANDLKEIRLGLSIGKKVGNAVVRNRWKRLIREAFRLHRNQLASGLDIVVRPRKGATCNYQSIISSLTNLVVKVERRIQKSSRETG